MENSKHTHPPYMVENTGNYLWIGTPKNNGAKVDEIVLGLEIEGMHPEAKARQITNAEFIVRACNSHYELLEALKEIEKLCDNKNPSHERIWKTAYSVIKKAEEQ